MTTQPLNEKNHQQKTVNKAKTAFSKDINNDDDIITSTTSIKSNLNVATLSELKDLLRSSDNPLAKQLLSLPMSEVIILDKPDSMGDASSLLAILIRH